MSQTDPIATLENLVVPGYNEPLRSVGSFVTEAADGKPVIRFRARFPTAGVAAALQSAAENALRDAAVSTAFDLVQAIEPVAVQRGLKPLPGVANLVAVASGKGGVGKSTTAVNLALALAALGARTGILDADIYGPSQPRMLGLRDAHPESHDGKTLQPLTAHGLVTMSAGFLVAEEQPMVWRGPMVTQALNQILSQTDWGELDYLIVDMPPGTGDIQLTLSQRVPVAGAVIVTTPQDIALVDARKGLAMFRKVGIDILGVVENMSTHVCSSCGHEEAIFGAGGAERLAAEDGVAVLGQLPLDAAIQRAADGGRPSVIADPDGAVAGRYRDIAMRVALGLARSRPEHAHKFPKIVVESDG